MSDLQDNSPIPIPPPPQEEGDDEHVQKVVVIVNSRAAADRRMKARRRLILIIAGVIAAAGVVWAIQHFSSVPLDKVASFETQVTTEVQNAFSSFPSGGVTSTQPWRVTAKQAVLTPGGIIADTNAARAANGGLPALKEEATLDDIATLRLDDLFAHQYFAHVDPQTGESALTVASSVGYNHIALGENLAEGFFEGDKGVLDAWMASPGHRANILDTHYTEIGVAAREGLMNGRQTWIAVQVFGKPTSACPPAPDTELAAAIANAESALTQMSDSLAQSKASIEAMQPKSGDAYNAKVSQYNALVSQYNALATQTKTEVAQYNGEVEAYNACL